MKHLTRTAVCVSGSLWVLGWFALYLEIYRWGHVTPSLHLNGWAAPPGEVVRSRPGGFLIAVLMTSVLAPPFFAALVAWNGMRSPKVNSSLRKGMRVPSQVALPMMLSGIAVCVLGAINHFIHAPRGPIDFDMTMRHGDGGFMVDGIALAALGLLLRRISERR